MSQNQNNSIEFQSAMENFIKMFPSMDRELIEEILRINQGSVLSTIDQLLTISGDCESFQNDPPTSSDSKKTRHWNPVLLADLDHNFLRINVEPCDEFAVMIQNEEFLEELRFNQEFLSALEQEQGRIDKPLEERLKDMGKVSRKKFQQLAKIFAFKRKKSSSQKPKLKLLEEISDDEAKK